MASTRPRPNPLSPAAAEALSQTVVRDESGLPRVVYHGTRTRFRRFGKASPNSLYGPGFYFTESLEEARMYSRMPVRMQGERISGSEPHVLKRYLDIRRPFDVEGTPRAADVESAFEMARQRGVRIAEYRAHEYREKAHKLYELLAEIHGGDKAAVNRWLQAQGYDALRYRMGYRGQPLTHWVAFSPEQIQIPGQVVSRPPVTPVTAEIATNPVLQKRGLQQIHVNLEGKIGQFLKRVMRLPFKRHSVADPMEASVQAFRMFRAGWQQFLSAKTVHSDSETAALTAYKGFGFRSINTALRAQSPVNLEAAAVVNTLDELTHAGTVEKGFSVFRGFHPFGVLKEPGSLVGREFTDLGFASTSLNPYVASEQFARSKDSFVAEIRLKRGQRGFYLASHQTWAQGDKEAEFLLPRGTRFRVLEELPRESAYGPRRLVLEAITPEHRPTPLQAAKHVAQEVRPSAGGAAAAAKTIAGRGTLNELHQNLESKTGQNFLRRMVGSVFKKHSRVDPLGAALQAQTMALVPYQPAAEAAGEQAKVGEYLGAAVGEEAERLRNMKSAADRVEHAAAQASRNFKFKFTPNWAYFGILGAVLVPFSIGAYAIQSHKRHQAESRMHPSTLQAIRDQIDRGRQEHTTTEFSTRTTPPAAPRGSTHIQISDAPLNLREVESAIAHHMTYGYAY